MTKFGFQCQFDSNDAARYNREIRPTTVMLINVTKRSFLEKLKAENPGIDLIYRHWPNYDWSNPTPEEAAEKAVDELANEIKDIKDLLTYVTENNEYILNIHHMPAEAIGVGDRYMAAFIRLARRQLKLGTCWGNFNTGHWAHETVEYFPLALAAAQEDKDSPICFHEYGWPVIRDDGHWNCGKVLRAMPPILERYPDVKCMITEFGVDDGGDPHKGWRLAHPDYGIAVSMFVGPDGIQWYEREVVNKSPWLQAVLFFGCGMVSPWESFDVKSIIPDIKNALGTQPPTPPPEEPVNDKIRVVDMEYNERDFAWAEQKYGVAFRRAQVAQGQKVYRLKELWEKTGTHSLITKVLDENGNPVENADVAFYWPDAPSPPEPETMILSHDWHENFTHGLTNENGEVGPGMGGGAWIEVDPNPPHNALEGGPHAVWVRDPDIPSDICEKLGMRGGTNHDHLDQVFQLTTEGETPQPPPTNGGEGMFVIVDRDDVPTQINAIEIEVAGDSTKNFYDTRFLMRIVGPDGEVWMDEDEFGVMHPEIRRFYKELPYVPTPGETARVYQFKIVKADDLVVALSGWLSFAFNRDEVKRTNAKVEWQEETEPPPTPPPTPPPSTDVPTRLRQIADELKGLADQWTGQASATEVRLIFPGGRQEVYKPSLTSAVARLMRRLRR